MLRLLNGLLYHNCIYREWLTCVTFLRIKAGDWACMTCFSFLHSSFPTLHHEPHFVIQESFYFKATEDGLPWWTRAIQEQHLLGLVLPGAGLWKDWVKIAVSCEGPFPVWVLLHFNSRTLSDALAQSMSQTLLVSISVAVAESNLGQGKDLSVLQVAMLQGVEDRAGAKGGRLCRNRRNPAAWLAFRLSWRDFSCNPGPSA